jgi:hypothetical protein
MKATLAIYNTISKVSIKELTTPLPKCFISLLDFPVSTSELSASTIEVQGPGAAQRAVSGAAAAALTGQSARVTVNKNTASAQRKTTAATLRREIERKQLSLIYRRRRLKKPPTTMTTTIAKKISTMSSTRSSTI